MFTSTTTLPATLTSVLKRSDPMRFAPRMLTFGSFAINMQLDLI